MGLQGEEQMFRKLDQTESRLEQNMKAAMSVWQILVANHAKANHVWAKSLSPEERRRHPDKRFYTHSSKLVNSIMPGEVRFNAGVVEGEVVAGGPNTEYAVDIEFGTPDHRAYPFLEPAAVETKPQALAVIKRAAEAAHIG